MKLSDDQVSTLIEKSRVVVSCGRKTVERVGEWQMGKSKTAGHYLRTDWIADGQDVFNFMFVPKSWIGRA